MYRLPLSPDQEEQLLRIQVAVRLSRKEVSDFLPLHEQLLRRYRDYYFEVGSRTGAADRERAERGVRAIASTTIGRAALESGGGWAGDFEWYASPAAAVERATGLPPATSLNGRLTSGIDRLRRGGRLRWPSAKQDDFLCHHPMRRDLIASLYGDLWRTTASCVREVLLRKNLSVVPDSEHAALGQCEACWLFLYAFVEHVLDVALPDSRYAENPHHWDDIAHSCFWWHAFEEVAVMCEHPRLIEWDDQDPPRLVRAEWSDGFVAQPL